MTSLRVLLKKSIDLIQCQRLKTHKSTFYKVFSNLTPDEAGRRAEQMAATGGTVGSISVSSSNKESSSKVKLATLLAHTGLENVPNAPMAPPLHLATTYTRPADGQYLETDSKYTRMDNPTRVMLEDAIFRLETIDLTLEAGGDICTQQTSFAFSSGMMAATAVILAHRSPVTIILPSDLYHGVPTLMYDVFTRHNVKIERVDMSESSNVLEAINSEQHNTDIIVWMESPSNPKTQIIDIQDVCTAIKSLHSTHSVTTVVDVTMSTPILTRPLELGADIAMHSGTKYLAGHSDVLLGVLTSSPLTKRGKDLAEKLRSVQIDSGGVASPFDSWLTLRGLRTLQIRIERQSQTAQALANYLDNHDLVSLVHYPGLPSHPQHEIARRQMKTDGFGGVLSLELESEVMATAFAGALKTIKRATSLGGTETLIEHRASVEPPGRVVSPEGLLRISVGLEDPEDLIQDVERALAIAHYIVSG